MEAALATLVTNVTTTIADILPSGLAIMGAMLGVSIIPKVIRNFF